MNWNVCEMLFLMYLFNLQCYLWFPLLSSDLFFPAGVYPTGFARRRFGVTDKTKRPPKKEFHPQQRATLRTRKIRFWAQLWSVELQFREHSEVTQLHFTQSPILTLHAEAVPLDVYVLDGARFQKYAGTQRMCVMMRDAWTVQVDIVRQPRGAVVPPAPPRWWTCELTPSQ